MNIAAEEWKDRTNVEQTNVFMGVRSLAFLGVMNMVTPGVQKENEGKTPDLIIITHRKL